MGKIKEYTNGDSTVVWDASKCIHSAVCVKGLPQVFRPKLRPWIKMDEAKTETIINQVKQCPSGALRYYLNGEGDTAENKVVTKVDIVENGPLIVYGTLKVLDKNKNETIKTKSTLFCRCGKSKNKPYCDDAHIAEKFQG